MTYSKGLVFLGVILVGWFGFAKGIEMIKISEPLSVELPIPLINGEPAGTQVLSTGAKTEIKFTYKARPYPPYSTTTNITVEYFRDIRTLEGIFKHFRQIQGQFFSSEDFSKLGALTQVDAPAGKVFVIDISKLGAAPGTQFVYILSKNGGSGALLLKPVDYLPFNWNHLKIKWP